MAEVSPQLRPEVGLLLSTGCDKDVFSRRKSRFSVTKLRQLPLKPSQTINAVKLVGDKDSTRTPGRLLNGRIRSPLGDSNPSLPIDAHRIGKRVLEQFPEKWALSGDKIELAGTRVLAIWTLRVILKEGVTYFSNALRIKGPPMCV